MQPSYSVHLYKYSADYSLQNYADYISPAPSHIATKLQEKRTLIMSQNKLKYPSCNHFSSFSYILCLSQQDFITPKQMLLTNTHLSHCQMKNQCDCVRKSNPSTTRSNRPHCIFISPLKPHQTFTSKNIYDRCNLNPLPYVLQTSPMQSTTACTLC